MLFRSHIHHTNAAHCHSAAYTNVTDATSRYPDRYAYAFSHSHTQSYPDARTYPQPNRATTTADERSIRGDKTAFSHLLPQTP